MFSRLKKRLIAVYGISTSLILFVIIAILFHNSNVQARTYQEDMFKKTVDVIAQKLQQNNSIHYTWIANMEKNNDLYINIEENGKEIPPLYSRNKSIKDMNHWISLLKRMAQEDGISLKQPWSKSGLVTTKVYVLKGAWFKRYLGTGIIVPTKTNCYTVSIISQNIIEMNDFRSRVLLFGISIIVGNMILFGISTLYIGKILKPLEEGQKRQVEFIAAASHELKAPITVIHTGLNTIGENHDEIDHFLPYIQEECNRMSRLVGDMLTLATSDAKTWSLKKEIIDMDTFLIEAYDMFCCLQDERNVSISIDIPEEELHTIYGDRERLKQVFTILVDNAFYYAPKESEIQIVARNKTYGIEIEVIDHGVGIPEEDKKLIFDRFFQSDTSRTDKKHFGLGLSIAKEIVSLHKGHLFVRDTKGGGATFVIQLNHT